MSKAEEEVAYGLEAIGEDSSIEAVVSGDTLFNYCCYKYLKNLFAGDVSKLQNFATTNRKHIKPRFDNIIATIANSDYQPRLKYGDIYRNTMILLEALVEKHYLELGPNHQTLLDRVVCRVYDNDNESLIHSYKFIANTIAKCDSLEEIETAITQLCQGSASAPTNQITPIQQGSIKGRLGAVLASNYKPMFGTSLPSVRRYAYNANSELNSTELRLGTQGQRVDNKERVSPLYKHFLRVKKKQLPDNRKGNGVSLVYFNDLAFDHKEGLLKIEGPKETKLSRALHALEREALANTGSCHGSGIELSAMGDDEYAYSNIVVITTPSDKGLMDEACLHHVQRNLPISQVVDNLLDIALERNVGEDFVIRDFHISERSRQRIFTDADADAEAVFTALLGKSLIALGLGERQKISSAERQALWIYCIKYEFTAYVLKKLDPDYYHMSCKDGIDRGGLHSALYNLFASINCGHPMTEDEFNQALHAAPTLVKGRGMNSHSARLWNVIDLYVRANQDVLENTDAAWLITWRDNYKKNYHKLLEWDSEQMTTKLASGIDDYLKITIPSTHFKKEGERRAQFYQDLLKAAVTEQQRSICCFALLGNPGGPTLRETLIDALGLDKGQLLLAQDHIRNQIQVALEDADAIRGDVQAILDDINSCANDNKNLCVGVRIQQIMHNIDNLGTEHNNITDLNSSNGESNHSH